MASTPDDAARIVDAILAEEPPEADRELYLGDLALHSAEFLDDIKIVERIGEEFPCVKRADGTTVPIDIARHRDLILRLGFWPFFRGLGSSSIRIERADEELIFVTPAAARAYLRKGMVSFLGSRIRSLRGLAEMPVDVVPLTLPNHRFLRGVPSTVSTSGFTVKVSATPGLRVHVSPTFRRSFRFFASPTSPAIGKLPGGIYEFAVDGGPYPTQVIDTGTFDIPYVTTTPVLAL